MPLAAACSACRAFRSENRHMSAVMCAALRDCKCLVGVSISMRLQMLTQMCTWRTLHQCRFCIRSLSLHTWGLVPALLNRISLRSALDRLPLEICWFVCAHPCGDWHSALPRQSAHYGAERSSTQFCGQKCLFCKSGLESSPGQGA